MCKHVYTLFVRRSCRKVSMLFLVIRSTIFRLSLISSTIIWATFRPIPPWNETKIKIRSFLLLLLYQTIKNLQHNLKTDLTITLQFQSDYIWPFLQNSLLSAWTGFGRSLYIWPCTARFSGFCRSCRHGGRRKPP